MTKSLSLFHLIIFTLTISLLNCSDPEILIDDAPPPVDSNNNCPGFEENEPSGFYCNKDFLPMTEIPQVQIGNQIWMSENMSIYTQETSYYYDFDCNYSDRGRLYYWSTVMNGEFPSNITQTNTQGICPDGWHIPSIDEWEILCEFLDDNQLDANALKANDISLWGNVQPGTNATGFNALPSGTYWRGNSTATLHEFDFIDKNVVYWSSTTDAQGHAMAIEIKVDEQFVKKWNAMGNARSLRCIKD